MISIMKQASRPATALLAVAAAMVTVSAAPSATTAQSRQVCDKRSDVLTHLAKKYSEKPAAVGVTANGGIVELLSQKDGKTWTLIVTMPNGISCLIAAGSDWVTRKPKQVGQRI